MRVVLDHLDTYWMGMRTTLSLSLLAFGAAFAIGLVVAAFRVSPVPPLRWAAAVWVEIVRNTPLAVQYVLFYFGFTKIGIQYAAFTSGVIVLAVYTSAFLAETIRAGVNTVAVGQAEAARAIGLTFPQTLRIVVLPQALRAVVAPIGNIFIALVKNSAVAGATISVLELTHLVDQLNADTARPVEVFLGAAIAYLLITIPAGRVFALVEHRVAIKR
jgi:glutamate transport system permease protein